ncbi:MAG: hypothetical protein A2563_02705 [Candidatus Magasanikbacteria bacterium RIFOXYD1_FULL_40_23]|uniref:PKD domain-containing protein n=1 Tax=Candidatus Magasanikbacteria bacterium RIFOXYD1_FULL_40_23 TaxID=1798705 RepID=A0A1F6P9G1_9BACT|nr:MAG: hypothetical protein A2563_02705 [Candidatus Magasanikbacteria bacterium RIFOXYD1_FULL_40_23]
MDWKKYLLINLILLGSFFVSYQVFGANTDVIINEIGAYEASGHEWIEIWNKGSEPVDIRDWKLWEENATSQNHKLTTTTDSVVSVGEYAVVTQDAAQFILDYPNFIGSVFDSSFVLNESGEEIGLIDDTGNVVEKFTYISASSFSLQRRSSFLADYTSSNWAEHISGNTVGAVNYFASVQASSTPIFSPAPAASQNTQQASSQINGSSVLQYQNLAALKINELVVDPESENEWVELYNTSQVSVDITDAIVCDARNTTSTCKKLVGAVGPNGWLFVDLQTRSFLNNSGDSVILKDARGVVVDRIDYEDELTPDEGQSLARKADGVDTDSEVDWVVTDTISPGKPNVIVSENQEEEGQKISSTTAKITKKIPSIFVWDIVAPTTAEINEQVMISAEDTADPRGGIISFVWDIGGSKLFGPVVTTSFATSGIYNVIVFATSTSGYGEQKNIEITVGRGLSQNAEVVISEILPNPDGDDSREFVEIKNNSIGQVNLSGWSIKVQDKKYIFPENTIVNPSGVLVFYKAVTKISLVNTAGKVELLNKDKSVVDLVKYDKPQAGQSYSLVNNQWVWTNPSPGTSSNPAGLVAGEKITNIAKIVGKSSRPLITKIADARGAVKGQYAKLKGVVSVLPGVFGSQYFYLNNDNAGIQIYQNKKDFPPLAVGDSVEIQGAVSEANGIKRINIKNSQSVDILSIHNRVTSTELNLDEIEESGAGALVWVEGQITEIKSTFMYVDNGVAEIKVYFKQGAKIDKQRLKEGEGVKVVGILENVKDEWQIWPRSNEDLESLGMPDSSQDEETAKSTTSPGEKYLMVTVGGVIGLLLAFLGKAKGLALVSWLKKMSEKLVKKP